MSAELTAQLFALQDADFRTFQCRLIPTVPPERVIGVRIPVLRKFAAQYAKITQAADFLTQLPHYYYEENNLHAFLIERIRPYEAAITATEDFLPYIDNWATCDSLRPKIFARHLDDLRSHIDGWLQSPLPYTRRFGIETLMNLYLDAAFSPNILEKVAVLDDEEYYVKMAAAWFFATALAKQPMATLPYFEQNRLEVWTHNKAIQKSIESYRVPAQTKEYLRGLRRT